MSRFIYICILFSIMVAGCQAQTPPPTSTPSPGPDPSVLDWHIQFSSNQDTHVFRCILLEDLAASPVSLMEPVGVSLTAVLVTPQMLQEAQRIIFEANPDTSKLQSFLDDSRIVIVLLMLDFPSTERVDEPFNMFLSTSDGGTPSAQTMFSLREIKFLFENETMTDDAVTLHIGEDHVTPLDHNNLQEELEIGRIYPIFFSLPEKSMEDLSRMPVQIDVDLEMLVPFVEPCGTGHFQEFVLSPRVISGDARILPSLYGTAIESLPKHIVDDFRLALLSNILPYIPGMISIPTATPSPKATTTSTQDAEPEITQQPA